MSSQTHKRFEKLKIKYIGVDCLKYFYKNNVYNKKPAHPVINIFII